MDKWLAQPTVLKLVALALGIMMWAVVHFDPESSPNSVASLSEKRIINSVKIQPYGLDERNFVMSGLQPETVKLTVRGSKSDLVAARTDEYKVRLDLRTAGEGKHTLNLEFDLPRGVQLVSAEPSTVAVTVDALQTKEFEVEIKTTGEPAQGFKAGTPLVKPSNRVHVTLPENMLAKVNSVGATIPVDGETETIKSKAVKLEAYDAKGKPIEGAFIDPAVVEVEVPITNPFKQVPLQFKLLGQMPSGLSIASFEPDVELVTVYGPQDALDRIDFIEADVQLSELSKSGKVTVPLKFEAPITEISPGETAISVEVVLSTTRKIEGLPIQWNGLGDSLKATIKEPTSGKVDIAVSGAPAMLDRLQPGDVQVLADLSGRGPGTYTLNLVVNLPRFISQVGVVQTVTVEITSAQPTTASAGSGDDGASVDGGDGAGDGGSGSGASGEGSASNGGSADSGAGAGSGDGGNGGSGGTSP